MQKLKLLVIIPALGLLSACGASAPSKQEIVELKVTPLAEGELPECESVYGNKVSKWTQCVSKNPTRYSDNGSTYKGTWVDGEPNGNGVIVYSGGGTYEGDVKKAYRHGDGVVKYSDGDTYRGHWVVGHREGSGILIWSNGYSFEGLWKNNGPAGRGNAVLTLPDGTKVEGAFKRIWPEMNGKAKVTFPDGKVWTGSGNSFHRYGTSVNGQVKLISGEIVDATIKPLRGSSCPADMRSCYMGFELEVTGLVGCKGGNSKEPAYSASGLPLQVGPLYLGMSFENFQCVMQNKFKDVTGENALTQGMLLGLGTPVSLKIPMDGDEIRFAKASLYTTSVEVSNLFSIPDWLRKPGKTGQVFGGQIEVLFWNDQLATVKLGQPSAPADYLVEKYGRARLDSKTHNEKCVQGNKVVSSRRQFISTRSWQDEQVKVMYEKGTGLEGGALATDSFIFGKGELPRCSAKIYSKNVYQLVDLKLISKYAAAKAKEEAVKKSEDRKLYRGF